MKDIKIKKVSQNKIQQVVEVENVIKPNKKSYSIFSTVLFSFMTISMVAYVFMISSSVYYAVQVNQYTFRGESISNSLSEKNTFDNYLSLDRSERISYINKDSDTSISLK